MYHNFSYTQVQIVSILDIRLFKSQCRYLFKVNGKGLASHDTLFFFFFRVSISFLFLTMQISQWWTKQLMIYVFLCSAVAITLMW